ncbi:MAG: hypothetical protein CVV27_04895, partial [Candidatus Melainabacteria bacterium HGW-Melainabacteria-1]
QSLQTSTRILAEVLLLAPPLLIFAGLAWLGWLLLKRILITHLALVQPRLLAMIYLLGLVYFPLSLAGGPILATSLAFALLLTSLWALKTIYSWAQKRFAKPNNVEAAAPVQAPAAQNLGSDDNSAA